MKTVVIAAAVLGLSLVVVGAGTVFAVALGTRALVVSAASVKPAAPLTMAPPVTKASGPTLRVAMH